MHKNIFQMFYITMSLFIIGTFSVVQASEGYTKTISMDGNNVEYNYVEEEKKEEEKVKQTPDTAYYFSVTPYNPYTYTYNRGYWGHYPSTGYHHPYGKGPIVYTYSSTGIKTGPDGRVITPLMERDMYNYRPPMPPPPRMDKPMRRTPDNHPNYRHGYKY